VCGRDNLTRTTPQCHKLARQAAVPTHAAGMCASPLAAELPVYVGAGGHTTQALAVQEVAKGLQVVRLLHTGQHNNQQMLLLLRARTSSTGTAAG
jgi:hypothetical protein